MNTLERFAASTKAFVMRFVTTSQRGWSLVSSRIRRSERYVGDGRDSSIVVATVGWIMRNFPEARLRVRQKGEKGELEETEDTGAAAMVRLLRKPNAFYSGVVMSMAEVADYTIDGNSYLVKIRNAGNGGEVVALWWLPSWTMEPKGEDEDGADFIGWYEYKPNATTKIRLEVADVVHHRYGFDPDNPRKGRSPLKSVLRELYTDDEAAAYTATILTNLGVPGIILSPDEENVDLDDDDADAINADFQKRFTGDGRGGALILGTKTKVDVVSFSPQQMNLKELRRIPEERVSGATGVPAIVAGLGAGLDRSTFANYGEAREAGYEENIIPTHRIFAADYDIQLLPDFVADPDEFETGYDYSEVRVLQEDQNKLWERGVNALSHGAILVSDFNRMVGLPVDEKLHDVYLRPANLVAVRVDSPEAIGEAEPEPEPIPGGQPPNPVEEDEDGNPIPGTAPAEPAVGSRNGNGRQPVPA